MVLDTMEYADNQLYTLTHDEEAIWEKSYPCA